MYSQDQIFKKVTAIVEDLLEAYEVNTADPDVQQTILNASVSLQNTYLGYDDDGYLVGVE